MQAKISEKLAQIRSALSEGDEAWGPDSVTPNEAADEAEAGDGGAENESDVNDTFYAYLDRLVAGILDEYEMSEDEAVDYVFMVAEDLAADGTLPEIPSEEDDLATAEWLGKAKSVMFAELVMAALESEAEEAGE